MKIFHGTYPYSLLIILFLLSCSKQEGPDPSLTEYQESVIEYFKEIALGFEFNETSEVTRKWVDPMRVYVLTEEPDINLLRILEETIDEINGLTSDGFSIEITQIRSEGNCRIFFGSSSDFLELYPEYTEEVSRNWGIFYIWWTDNIINRGVIFIDTIKPTLTQQKSLIKEELTQSLGFGKDSPRYKNSIFYETPNDGGFATEYSQRDRDLIRLLYHPRMEPGLNKFEVDERLREILISEN